MLISYLAAQTDLFSFHEAHFGGAALATFATDFFDPDKIKLDEDVQHDADEEYYEYYEEEDDDGLGYYPDGVKRTLTDEQIAMFRHSEIQALRKAQEEASEKTQRRRRNSSSPVPMDLVDGSSGEEGELQDDQATVEQQTATATKKKKKNKKKKRGSGNGNANANKRWEPDPERRKRTWDVVDTGLDALDYGEMDRSGASREHVAQRRRVTYDDD